MSTLYHNRETQEAIRTLTLPNGLSDLLSSPLITVGGAVVLEQLEREASLKPSQFESLTTYESAVNHIHIRDYVEASTRNIECLQIGIVYALRLAEKLSDSSTGESYQAILSTDWESYGDCVVRFVKVREGQGLLSDDNDLEGFSTEGVLVLET